MGKKTWKQAFFLGAALLAACFFWQLERQARIVMVPDYEPASETETEKTDTGETEEVKEETAEETEKESLADRIRVLIRSDNFTSEYQKQVSVMCLKPSVMQEGTVQKECGGEESLFFSKDDGREDGTVITLSGREEEGSFQLLGLKRGYENPVYEGTLKLVKRSEGYLVINELPLEQYLLKVLPSEMPASYPLEALKAQAVCARTYAVGQMENPRMEEGIEADVDDSVNYQVYNNQPEDERCTQAVEETKGLLLQKDGSLVNALYYSTSCGIDLERDLSKETVFCAFLSMKNDTDYEKDEPWYRWNTYFSVEQLTELSGEAGYGDVGEVTALVLGEREESGCLTSLTIKGTEGETAVSGEYNIRKFLNPKGAAVTLQSGEAAPDLGMLPSAFFYLMPSYDGETLLGYQVIGGGYGHGRGMSQNGARNMAEEGMDFQEILTYYYGEIELYDATDTGN